MLCGEVWRRFSNEDVVMNKYAKMYHKTAKAAAIAPHSNFVDPGEDNVRLHWVRLSGQQEQLVTPVLSAPPSAVPADSKHPIVSQYLALHTNLSSRTKG